MRSLKYRYVGCLQQLEMLEQMRKFHLDDQLEILEKVYIETCLVCFSRLHVVVNNAIFLHSSETYWISTVFRF